MVQDASIPMQPSELKREVALGVTNLGSTCYMNAVLQALAHAPELCMAMDCEPHHITCPIARENAEKRRRASPKPSPDGAANTTASAAATTEKKTSSGGTRKSRRSGKKSPSASSDGEDGLDLTFCALCEVEQHLARVHEPQASSVPSSVVSSKPESDAIAPHVFVNGFISDVAPWFKLGVQEDSHEFLRLLIDAMQKSCTGARSTKNRDPNNAFDEQDQHSPREEPEDKEDRHENKTEKTEGEEARHQEVDNEYPFKLFRGTVKSIVTCDSCGTSSSKIDPIEDIGLEVTPPSSDPRTPTSSTPPPPAPNSALADVSQAFQRFARAERLDSGYKCDKCGKVGKATKQSRLGSIPPILTLHLKRFRYGSGSSLDKGGNGSNGGSQLPRRTGRSELSQLLGSSAAAEYYGGSGSAKIEGHIKFDQIFDIRPYLVEELQQNHKSMFCRLFAVVVHAGKNSHSGHYIAYVRNVGRSEWWKMDDARVTRASLQEVMNAEAYMLFYRVVDHPVAVDLRNVAKAKEEAAAAAKAALEQAAADKKKAEITSEEINAQTKAAGDKKRKRDPPKYTNAEEWARVKTRFPPSFKSFFRRAEEFISENVEFRSEFFSLIKEEAARGGKVGRGPKGVSTDDVFGGAEKYRGGFIELIYNLASRTTKDGGKDGVFFSEQESTSLKKENTSESGGITKEKSLIVPVVEANENFL